MRTLTDEELHVAVRNTVASLFGWRVEDVPHNLPFLVADFLINVRRIADAVEEIAAER